MAAPPPSKATQKSSSHNLFQCSACKRTYTRVDHLARHVRSHLHERPFQCQTCSKSFGRLDLLKRHAANHQADSISGKTRRSHVRQGPRVSQACRECATAKLKCDDEKPCGRCRQRGIVCEYVSDGSTVPLEDCPPLPSSPAPSTIVLDPAAVLSPPASLPVFPDHEMPHDMAGFLRGVMTPATLPWMDADVDSIVPRMLFDFGSDDLSFHDVESFNFLDLGGTSVPLHALSEPQPQQQQQQPLPPSHSTELVGLGTAAFQRSTLGIWLPAVQDRTDTALEHLAALNGEAGASPDTTRIPLERRLLVESLSRTARDEMLAMVLRSCRPERATFIVRTFPPAELLTDLIECFFAHHRQLPDSIFHIPTFRLHLQPPELLGTLTAFGATLTDLRALHRMGLAMHEAVRTALPARCEEANVRTRELWLLQTFLCELQIGMWSGIKRKMEIAESHTLVLYTMLRRAGRFRRLQRPVAEPLHTDTGDVLQRKWLDWAEQETLRRLVFHAFAFDAQVSMARLTTPIISYAELALPLPASRALWLAEDAEQWKALYLERPSLSAAARHLSLADLLQPQPIELPDSCDTRFASLIALYGIWGMVWQHLQLSATLQRAGQASAGTTIRLQELQQMLHRFRVSVGHGHGHSLAPETSVVLELLHLYLHVNLGDMQLFAGKEGIEDARRVFPALQQWIGSPDARTAVWHAGQVLRAARCFPARQLHRFYAVAVYHAGLVLWVYGVVATPTKEPMLTPTVCLDGPESPTTQRFLAMGKGTPCIGPRYGTADMQPELVPLGSPEAVMGIVAETLQANFPAAVETQELPPLVQNLIQLLRDLGKAAGEMG